MRTTQTSLLVLLVVGVVTLPAVAHAITSNSFQLDAVSGYTASGSHSPLSTGDYDLDSASFKLEASIEPLVGSASTASFQLETGGEFESYCGDGFADPTETCDGSQLKGETCMTQGFTQGSLSCSSSCALVTTQCSNNAGGGGGGASGGGGGGSAVSDATIPTINQTLLTLGFTYETGLILFGTKEASASEILINGLSTDVIYPNVTSWKRSVGLALGSNAFEVKAKTAGVSSGPASFSIYRRMIGDI